MRRMYVTTQKSANDNKPEVLGVFQTFGLARAAMESDFGAMDGIEPGGEWFYVVDIVTNTPYWTRMGVPDYRQLQIWECQMDTNTLPFAYSFPIVEQGVRHDGEINQ